MIASGGTAGQALLTALLQAQHDAGTVDLPPSSLPGWQGLCAAEYQEAAKRVREHFGTAVSALDAAVLKALLL